MSDFGNMVGRIWNALGEDASYEDARRLYWALRADNVIQWDDRRGLVLDDGVDLLAAYARHFPQGV